MKTTKTKTFDAVTESRRWKEAVARETEQMTRAEVLGFFSKERALSALRCVEPESCIVREESPQ